MKRNEGNAKAKNKPLSSIKRPPRQRLIISELEASEDQKEESGERRRRAFAKRRQFQTRAERRALRWAEMRRPDNREAAGRALVDGGSKNDRLGRLRRGRSTFICPSQFK